MTARAVEQLVCESLCVEHDWDTFMIIACMESIKAGTVLPGPKWLANAVAIAKRRDDVRQLAGRIIEVSQTAAKEVGS